MNTEHILLADTMWGPITAEQAKQHTESRIFSCGHCSDALTTVYHNIIGIHQHCSAAALREKIAVGIGEVEPSVVFHRRPRYRGSEFYASHFSGESAGGPACEQIGTPKLTLKRSLFDEIAAGFDALRQMRDAGNGN